MDQLNQNTINALIFGVVMIFAIPLHEFGHALAAHLCGDTLPEAQGRLTPEPWAHWDLFGSLLIALGIFSSGNVPVIGFGKPVITDTAQYRNGRWGRLLVAFAGIAVNILLALIGAAIYRGFHLAHSSDPAMAEVCQMFVTVNLYLATFNLLPIPPLDGSKILFWSLPAEKASRLESRFTWIGFLILWLLIILGGRILGIPAQVASGWLLGV